MTKQSPTECACTLLITGKKNLGPDHAQVICRQQILRSCHLDIFSRIAHVDCSIHNLGNFGSSSWQAFVQSVLLNLTNSFRLSFRFSTAALDISAI
jgi:hypothetical protein